MTIEEMANELGVSKSTVSRALTGKGRIGAATRERIRAFAKENAAWEESSVVQEKVQTRNLAVVLPNDVFNTSTPFFHECLLGIAEMAEMFRYHPLLTTGKVNDISAVRELVEKKKIDGAILMRSVENDRLLEYLTEQQVPTGLVGSCDFPEVIQVDSDARKASESMMSLLISQGYRRFALLVGDHTYNVNQNRLQGCLEAIEKQGLSRESRIIYQNFSNIELAGSIIDDILNKKIECIVCGDDVICTWMMSRLQAEGYRIPRDISIVSLYNSSSLECFSPTVTAVSFSARQMGSVVCKKLISFLQGEDTGNKKQLVGYEILLRNSVGKIYGA